MQFAAHPLAHGALPAFITAPHETDTLMVAIAIFLIVTVFLLGVGFLWLHSLPERMAHKAHKIQFEIVAVLCLLSLLTHNNFLWGAALLLALIDLPDFGTPLARIAQALERMGAGARASHDVAPLSSPAETAIRSEAAATTSIAAPGPAQTTPTLETSAETSAPVASPASSGAPHA
jgi:hypothetical protein